MNDEIKLLEVDKIWTGDGFGASDAILLHQVKRKGNVAIYSVSKEKTPHMIRGYEVFRFKTVLKGTPLPGNLTVDQTYEQYPGSNMFGKTAWAIGGEPEAALKAAGSMFERLIKEDEVKAVQTADDAANGIVTKRRGRPKKVVAVD